MTPYPSTPQALAQRLADAYANGRQLDPSEAWLVKREEAYQVQEAMLVHSQQPIAAWKVGTCTATDGLCGSPLPRSALRDAADPWYFSSSQVVGLEVELAFRLSSLALNAHIPLSMEVFLAQGMLEMALSVEVVSSRWQGWPDVPDLLKLADWQNHGGLVLGNIRPYDSSFPFLTPAVQLMVDGQPRAKFPATNPAGDPRRLIPPFIRQCQQRQCPIQPEHWITTGSYSGIFFVHQEESFHASMEELPAIHGKILRR